MLAFIVFVQSHGVGFDWSSEQVRTFLMGGIFSSVLFACRVLLMIQKKTEVLHRDIRGDEKNPGLMDIVKRNSDAIEKIKLRNYKIDILDAAEKDLHPGENRRHSNRRARDKMSDTYEHPKEDGE
jgi:hypothetical protein